MVQCEVVVIDCLMFTDQRLTMDVLDFMIVWHSRVVVFFHKISNLVGSEFGQL